MPQWEYNFVTIPALGPAQAKDQLNALGADGWEVCGVEYRCWVLKRPVQGMDDGTAQIADHFADLASSRSGVRFSAPADAVAGWLPAGYQQVMDPNHIVRPDDCIMPSMGGDWRLVSAVNAGSRIGLRAQDIGTDVVYVATFSAGYLRGPA